MSLLEVEEKGQIQNNIWKHSINLDVQEPHNPCFCLRIGQTGIIPTDLGG